MVDVLVCTLFIAHIIHFMSDSQNQLLIDFIVERIIYFKPRHRVNHNGAIFLTYFELNKYYSTNYISTLYSTKLYLDNDLFHVQTVQIGTNMLADSEFLLGLGLLLKQTLRLGNFTECFQNTVVDFFPFEINEGVVCA